MHKKQEMWVWSLGQDHSLEKEMTTHSSIPAWKIPWIEEPRGYKSWVHKELDPTGHTHSVVVDSLSPVPLFATQWTAACQTSLSLIISQSLAKFMSIASVMSSSHLILWCPLLLLPSIFPSVRDFSNESAVHIRWPKYWSFSFSIFDILLSKGLSGVFSSTIVQRHQLFALCLIYSPALTTVSDHWEDHSLIIGTFVSRVLFLLFTSGLSLP